MKADHDGGGIAVVLDGGVDAINRAAHALAIHGVCVLRGAGATSLVDAELCASCRQSLDGRLERLLAIVHQQDFGVDETWRYEEVCHRHERSRRYDLSIATCNPVLASKSGLADAVTWTALRSHVDRWARPVIEAAINQRGPTTEAANRATTVAAHCCMAGCVVAAAGAPHQPYHCDGDNQLYNVFCPLVAVSSLNGPTEFKLGTHVESPDASEALRAAPEVGLGELLIFDYRVEHRGTANSTARSRPVAYFTYAPDGVEHDLFNFPIGVSLLAGQSRSPVDDFFAGIGRFASVVQEDSALS